MLFTNDDPDYIVEETELDEHTLSLFMQLDQPDAITLDAPLEICEENRGRVWPDHVVGVNTFKWRGGYGV